MRLPFFILILVCCLANGFAQTKFEHLDTRNGLSQNDINFIFQGSKGFMWFGTMDGLNRYDGISFKNYQITTKMECPIGSNLPFCMQEDEEGNFWIGTSDSGIWFFDRKNEEFTQVPIQQNGENVIVDKKVSCLLLDRKGFLWIGSENGMSVLNTNAYYEEKIEGHVYGSSVTASKKVSFTNVYDLIEDSEGVVWMATREGVFQVELDANDQFSITTVSVLPRNTCRALLEIEGGFLASCASGVFYFTKDNIDKGTKARYALGRNFTSLISTSQTCFFGGNTTGLYKLEWDYQSETLKQVAAYQYEFHNEQSLSKSYVVDLYEDRSGLLWVGTNGGGLNKLDLNEKKFDHVYQTSDSGSLGYNKVRTIHEDQKQNLWVGTEGGGLAVLPAGKRGTPFSGFLKKDVSESAIGQNSVYDIMNIPNQEDKVLICMSYPYRLGIASLQDEEIVFTNFSDVVKKQVFCGLIDRSGFIWLGTYGGGVYKCIYKSDTNELKVLRRFKGNKWKKGSLSSGIVRSLLENDNGDIYVGTDLGLHVLSAEEKGAPSPFFQKAQFIKGDSTSLSHNYVLELFKDSDGNIWVGTMGGGLCLLEECKNGEFKFKRYTSENGLPNDVIKAIEQDEEGYLWISTNKGLTKFNPKSQEIRNYSISDGLQDFEFSELASLHTASGEMYFGGVNGYNVFRPSEIEDNPYASQVGFTGLYILNEEILPGVRYNNRILMKYEMPSLSGVRLKYAENSFTIGFSAFHFAAPEKIKYKYKLEGFDEGWNMVTEGRQPKAIYTNIPPGEYVLKVLATNNDGIWNRVPATFEVEITPPFWSSEFAIVSYILLFFVFLLFVKKYSVIAVTQKNELMMEHFEQEKIEELMQMKLQFFTNISHEFRTPLTLIQSPLEKLMEQGDAMEESHRQKYFSLMNRNVAILNRLINQLMDFRKLERGKMPLEVSRGNLNDLIGSVFAAFEETAINKNIRFEMRNAFSYVELWCDYDKIEKVLYNILSNAFKFTPTKGEITIQVEELILDGVEWVQIDVKDNGPGIEKEKMPFLFQRFYQAGSHQLSKVSGTGIGLAFAKSLVELHHGILFVESTPEVSTTFSIRLRKGKLQYAESDFTRQTPDAQIGKIKVLKDYQDGAALSENFKSKEKSIDKTRKTILVVEDNHDVQALLKENLEESFNCVQAFNGVEGVELCKKYSPDLIVSDVMMPKMDGYELCEAIKKEPTICHIPIVMLTARSSHVDKLSGFEGGAEAYVSKPFNVTLLVAQVNAILESRRKVKERFSKQLVVEPEEVTFTSIDEKLIARMLRIIEKNMSNPEFTVVQLASEVGMSQPILNKKLKALLGQTANVFIRSVRLKRAGQLLKLQRLNVMDVVYEVGFNDVKYFRECFRKQFNTTPTEYIKQFRQEEDATVSETEEEVGV